MSRKKHKKRHSSTVSAARAKLRDEQLAEDKARYGNRMNPTARNLLLTPICPHSTRSSSYVLSPEHVITVEAPDANRKFVYLSVDGGKAFSLKNNDQVRVSTSRYTTKLVRLSKKSFCEILDKKMGGEVTKA